MSANRSVQAAQRRRAGPSNSESGTRGPQPSINSSQMFSSQGKGPNMPNGRLAGQQVTQQQQQQQQQQQSEGLSSVSKMTIPQAITLITLRLGAVETKLINLHESGSLGHTMSVDENGSMDETRSLLNNNIIQSITSRLESLEKRSSTSGSGSGPEFNLLKQQFETVKTAVIQTKSIFSKENLELKTTINNLKTELAETKELLHALQNITMDNSQKIMDLSVINMGGEEDGHFSSQLLDENVEYSEQTELDNLDDTINDSLGNNLKELIESEINADM